MSHVLAEAAANARRIKSRRPSQRNNDGRNDGFRLTEVIGSGIRDDHQRERSTLTASSVNVATKLLRRVLHHPLWRHSTLSEAPYLSLGTLGTFVLWSDLGNN